MTNYNRIKCPVPDCFAESGRRRELSRMANRGVSGWERFETRVGVALYTCPVHEVFAVTRAGRVSRVKVQA